jgi:large subunit ribosomal protein L11
MAETIEVLVPGGEATPGPPLGPELGPTPVDVQAVVNEINEQTAAFEGTEVPVTVTYEEDGSFEIEVGVPPTAELIKDEAGFETGSGEPQENFVADLSVDQIKQIAGRHHRGGQPPRVQGEDRRRRVRRRVRRRGDGVSRRPPVPAPAGQCWWFDAFKFRIGFYPDETGAGLFH